MNINNITLTFFPVDINVVKNYFISAIGKQYSMRYIDNYTESIRSYYNQQYDAPQVKFLLFSPKSNPHTTIMFANIIDGYLNLVKYISKKYDIEYYNISIFDDSQSQVMNSYHFHYYSKDRERHLLCYQDPQWVFFDEGEPLWFENTSYRTHINYNFKNVRGTGAGVSYNRITRAPEPQFFFQRWTIFER